MGHTTITAGELYRVVAESIRRSPDLTPAEKVSHIAHLADELYMQLGLKEESLLRLPYARR
jgi:hypothetical protein